VAERVRFGGACDHPARAARRHVEAVAEDTLDAGAREQAGLLGDLVRRADVNAAA